MDWLRKIFKLKTIRDDISSTLAEFPKLPNATALKEKFEAERNAQKENSWAYISKSIESAMSRGKGYVLITADVNSAKYCYDMGYDLSICWE